MAARAWLGIGAAGSNRGLLRCICACPATVWEAVLPLHVSRMAGLDPPPSHLLIHPRPLTQGTANPVAALKAKLDRLQRVGLTVQNVLDGVACAMERFGVRSC